MTKLKPLLNFGLTNLVARSISSMTPLTNTWLFEIYAGKRKPSQKWLWLVTGTKFIGAVPVSEAVTTSSQLMSFVRSSLTIFKMALISTALSSLIFSVGTND